jgi:esterase/lipase superfamily enzyme
MFKFLLIFLLPLVVSAQPDTDVDRRLYNIVIDKTNDGNGFEITYEVYFEKSGQRDEFYRTSSLDTFLLVLHDDLRQLDVKKNDLLVYIHGMWGGTNHMFRQASHLMHEAYVDHPDATIGRILSIKWPGNTSMYKTNRAAALALAPQLKRVFNKLFRTIQILDYLDYRKDFRISLLAHSLGNEIFKEFFHYYDEEDLSNIYFDEIILAAPDLDDNLFESDQILSALNKVANRVHVYFSRKDFTLNVSQAFNEKNRLGVTGPSQASKIAENVFFVDVTDIKDERNLRDRFTGHSYYRISEQATSDMRALLCGRTIDSIENRILMDPQLNIYRLLSEEDQP